MELSNSRGWRVMHWGPLSPDSPRSSRVSDSLLRCCCGCGGANPARGGPRLRPLTLPDTRQKGRSNHGPKRVGEQEVSILQRRKTLTRTPPRQLPGEAPRAPAGGGARGCRGRPPPHPGPAPVPPTPGSSGA